jgi:hypothetical protein
MSANFTVTLHVDLGEGLDMTKSQQGTGTNKQPKDMQCEELGFNSQHRQQILLLAPGPTRGLLTDRYSTPVVLKLFQTTTHLAKCTRPQRPPP